MMSWKNTWKAARAHNFMIKEYNSGSSLKRIAKMLSKRSSQMDMGTSGSDDAGPMEVEGQDEMYDKGDESEGFMEFASQNGLSREDPHYQLCQDAYQAGVEKGSSSGTPDNHEDWSYKPHADDQQSMGLHPMRD